LFFCILTTSVFIPWIPTKSGDYSLIDFVFELVRSIQLDISYGIGDDFWLLILIPCFLLLIVFLLYCLAAFGIAWIAAAFASTIHILIRFARDRDSEK